MAQNRLSNATLRGLGSEEVRRNNLTAVLDRLHVGGSLSRSELAKRTGLNRSTIHDLIGELVELSLVVETRGTPAAGPGRPSSMAEVSPAGAVVLAVEIEVDSIAVATIGLGGHIFDEVREPNAPRLPTPEEAVSRLATLAEPLLRQLPPDHTFVGVGVGVAGVVRRADGFVHTSPNLEWNDVPIAEMVAEKLDADLVRVGNEADVGALAECRRGAGRDAGHVLYVAGEVGVGVGIIHEAAPLHGAAGYAGEAGHMMINPDGRQCRCGSTGCWETEVGEEALIERAGLRDWSETSPLTEIVRRAGIEDPQTREALRELGRWLGIGIGNLINVFNPEMVVVGGFFHDVYPFMAADIDDAAKRIALDAPWNACTITRSEAGRAAVLMGAAELVLGEVVADPSTLIDRRPTGSGRRARHSAY